MAIVEITATLDGEGTQSAGAAADYEAASSMPGTSAATASAGVLLSATSAMSGESSASSGPVAAWAAAAALLGGSTLSASAGAMVPITVSLAGSSVFSASMASDLNVILALVGNSGLTIDPTKVTVTNFSRGPQVPSTAKPPVIPTIRIVPPAPPQASYSVSPPTNRNRRREDA